MQEAVSYHQYNRFEDDEDLARERQLCTPQFGLVFAHQPDPCCF